jgi:hypothetical protein
MALCLAVPASGQDDLQSLVNAGKLSVSSRISGSGQVVPGQRAELTLEVATSTWFTGGTRIRIPEVPGLVILQTEQFAANASETRNGKSWVLQRWTLDVYPQRAGDFTLPAIALSLNVNGGERGSLTGELLSQPLDFSVQMPAALAQADFWVASPTFSVAQSLDRETGALEPGDAFERRIVFKADDVQAMMLPAFKAERLPGLAAYPAPPELTNSNNRGQTTASRVQTISYVAEAPGDYVLPATDFFWWNTRKQVLEVLTLPALDVHVKGVHVSSEAAAAKQLDKERVMTVTAATLLALLLLWLLFRYRPWGVVYRHLEAPVTSLRQSLRNLRRPALPERLNPDNNAED